MIGLALIKGQQMNITAWILAGGVIGWIAFFYLRFNRKSGVATSMMIGMAGSVAGGTLLAPLLETVPVYPGDLNPLALAIASAAALATLTIVNMVHREHTV